MIKNDEKTIIFSKITNCFQRIKFQAFWTIFLNSNEICKRTFACRSCHCNHEFDFMYRHEVNKLLPKNFIFAFHRWFFAKTRFTLQIHIYITIRFENVLWLAHQAIRIPNLINIWKKSFKKNAQIAVLKAQIAKCENQFWNVRQ